MANILLITAISKNQNILKSTLIYFKRTFNWRNRLLLTSNYKNDDNINYSTAAEEIDLSAISWNQAKPVSEIPGPKSFPIIGSTLAVMLRKDFDKDKFYVFWKNMFKEFGPIVRLKFPGEMPMILLYGLDDIETLFRVTMDNPVRAGFSSLKKIRRDEVNHYFEGKTGLLPENNKEWWRVRNRVQTPMLKPKNILRYLPLMDEVALDFIDRIAILQEEYNEMPENFQEEIYKWALESVGLVALNRRLMCLKPNLAKDSMQMRLINSANNIFRSLDKTEFSLRLWRWIPTPSYRKLQKAHRTFLEIADENIRQTEASLIGKREFKVADEELTLMEYLLMTEGLSRKDVVTLMLDMLFGGIDTTSHTVGFMLYLLAKNPQAQKKLQKEIDEVLGDGKEPLTDSHLKRLSYLKACVKESLRVFPVTSGSARILQKDVVLGGYAVPKGHQIIALSMIAGWDENNFERATEYLPERWSRHRPLGDIHPYSTLPFSHGTRMCIGRRIAEQEIYTLLARIFHRYNVEYNYGEMSMKSFIVFKPSKPLKFKFTERVKN